MSDTAHTLMEEFAAELRAAIERQLERAKEQGRLDKHSAAMTVISPMMVETIRLTSVDFAILAAELAAESIIEMEQEKGRKVTLSEEVA